MNTAKRWICVVGIAAAAWGCGVGVRGAEPLWLGDDGDCLAVVALVPGDEVTYAGGVLQKCQGLDIPAKVFFLTDDPELALSTVDAGEALGLQESSFATLHNLAEELGPALAYMKASMVIASPELAEPGSPLHAAAAAVPHALVLAGTSEDAADSADFEFELTDVQVDGKEEALEAYGMGGATPLERFRKVAIQAQAAKPPEAETEPQPLVKVMAPEGAGPEGEVLAVEAVEGEATPTHPVATPPAKGKSRRLVPRTQLPSVPEPVSPLDEPVFW